MSCEQSQAALMDAVAELARAVLDLHRFTRDQIGAARAVPAVLGGERLRRYTQQTRTVERLTEQHGEALEVYQERVRGHDRAESP